MSSHKKRHQPLRRIVVDGEVYLWRFAPGYVRTNEPGESWRCLDTFTAYLASSRRGALRITFETGEDAILGGPLRTGAPLDLEYPASGGVNLHTPKFAALLIRKARRRGWNPAVDAMPFEIADGVTLLAALPQNEADTTDNNAPHPTV